MWSRDVSGLLGFDVLVFERRDTSLSCDVGETLFGSMAAVLFGLLNDGEALALVPYADLINHSPFSQAYIDAREGGDWLFSSGEEEVILYADRGYRRMEQVNIVQLLVRLRWSPLSTQNSTLFRLHVLDLVAV